VEYSEKDIRLIVEEVVKRVSRDKCPAPAGRGPLFESMEKAVQAAGEAQKQLIEMGMEKRRVIIANMREAAVKHAERLARQAWEETKMGRWENKVKKNLLAAQKTPGVEDLEAITYTGDFGLTLVERAPFGIVAAVTPSTNPSATVINNSISIISAGNAVVFAPHPGAKAVSHETMRILNEAIIAAGGPEGLIVSVAEPSVESTQQLLRHPRVRMNLVTGGPAIVKLAMSAGKKTIAAGPGNPPVVVDETAVFPKCVDDIIKGASFDNGILCTAEKEVVVVEAVAEKFLSAMRRADGVYELSRVQMDKLAGIVMKKPGGPGVEAVMNREYVGRNANVIARSIGLNLPDSILLLWGEVPNDHPFVWSEQLMPVLPVTRVADIDTAIRFAVEVEGGNGHTAVMHSLNIARLSKMAKEVACSIFVKNGPSYMGLGSGEGYASLSIATPTGDGLVRARHFTRPLRCVLVDYFRIA